MKVPKSSGVNGKWIDKKALKKGDIAKIVSEATEVASQQGGTQWVAKIKVKGWEGESQNISINKPTRGALIDAFGDESKDWIDKLLSIHVESMLISGKRGIAVYLLPEGYDVGEDTSGYIVIKKQGSTDVEELTPEDIPF